MNPDPTPDSPLQEAAETGDDHPEQAGEPRTARPEDEPTGIADGSGQRRTAPPAWSDEALGDAWAHMPERDQPASPAALQVEQQTSADSASAQSPAQDEAAELSFEAAGQDHADERTETEQPGLDFAAAAEPDAADEAGDPPLRDSARAVDSGNDAASTARPENGQTEPWVQGPTGETVREEPTELTWDGPSGKAPVEPPTDVLPVEPPTDVFPAEEPTAELPVAGPGDEIPAEEPAARLDAQTAELLAQDQPTLPAMPASEADPESGGRWQVVPEQDEEVIEPTPGELDGKTREDAMPVAPLVRDEAASGLRQEEGTSSSDGEQPGPQPAPQLKTQSGPQPAPRPSPQLKAQPAAGRRERTGTLSGAIDILVPHLRPHRPALIVGLVALVLSIWLLVALPFPLKYAVDAALATAGVDAAELGDAGSDPSRSLLISVGVLVLMVALQAGLRAISVSALNRAGGRVATDLRSRLLRHLHRLSPGRDIDSLDRTTLPLVEDVAQLRDLIAHAGPRIAAGLFALASLLVVVLVVEPLAALIVAVTGALYALVARGSRRQARRKDAGAEADELVLAETAEELLSATRTVQSYGLEARAEQSLAEVGARAGRSRAAARRARTVGDFLAELIMGAGVATALLLGGARMSAGTMSPGELTLVIAHVLIAVILVREVVRHSGTLTAARGAGHRVNKLLDHRAAITEPERTQPIDRVRGEIVFSAINAPGPRGPLFNTVSLVIPAGQHVAMLDREDDETSALISYLLRFDQPETGRVLLDRYDTRAVPLADLRRQIALVQREPALFTDTIRQNIRVGRPEATDDEIVQAARRSGADEFITLLPEGYDTQLLRRGARLSDGQRRLIAIARALLRDAPIVVLDRTDDDIAPTERDAVRRGLAALLVGRTALIHSRDPENIVAADRVLWLGSGAIIEDDDPRELAEDPNSWLSAWIRAAEETGR